MIDKLLCKRLWFAHQVVGDWIKRDWVGTGSNSI